MTMTCNRCGEHIHDAAFVVVHVASPIMQDATHALMCGKCSIDLGEFLEPSIVNDPEYIEAKADLLKTMKSTALLRKHAAQRKAGRRGRN